MAKYLKKFENHAAYETAQSGLILPNVSLCVSENEVHYNPYVDPYVGHAYVDLGLPSGTKWATMNVGALSETDYGNYYKYGLGASQYDSAQADYYGTENPLAASADTAVQVWGGQWHTPTKAQFEELISNTTYEWITIGGINGGKFTAQNGNYVFLPASGSWYWGTQYGLGESGYYWGSTYPLCEMSFGSERVTIYDEYRPENGYSVRPVVG